MRLRATRLSALFDMLYSTVQPPPLSANQLLSLRTVVGFDIANLMSPLKYECDVEFNFFSRFFKSCLLLLWRWHE